MMPKRAFYIVPTVTAASMPLVAAAQRTFATIVNQLIDIINQLVIVLTALALVAFLWGIAEYLLNLGNAQKRAEARNFMVWGVIALFILVSVFGILEVLQSTFFGGGGGAVWEFGGLSEDQYRDPFGGPSDENPIRDFEGLDESQY